MLKSVVGHHCGSINRFHLSWSDENGKSLYVLIIFFTGFPLSSSSAGPVWYHPVLSSFNDVFLGWNSEVFFFFLGLDSTFWFASLVFWLCVAVVIAFTGRDKRLIQTWMGSFTVIWCLKTTAAYFYSPCEKPQMVSHTEKTNGEEDCGQVLQAERDRYRYE